jgi:hypothetical protein
VGKVALKQVFRLVFQSFPVNFIPLVPHYKEEDNNNNNNNNNNNTHHHKVAQEASSVCCGILHKKKKIKSWFGILWCGFSFKFFNLLPSASSKPILYTL